MKFAIFMASPLGRMLRLVPGLILGGLAVAGNVHWAFGLIGLVLIASGALNICVLSKLFGGPFKGRDAK